ncbi:MAG: hypothetical protein AAF628_16095 [Planctomycetota bacterium]
MFCTLRRILFLVSGLVAPLAGQSSNYMLAVGGQGAVGCQGAGGAPILSAGADASATIAFDYDATTHLLTLDVANSSPVAAGASNPILTAFAIVLPRRTVNSVTLVSQSSAAAVTPAFTARFDPNMTQDPWAVVGCLGRFSVLFQNGGIAGGIANPAATQYAVPASSLVRGDAQFVLRLGGPGVDFLQARTIALAYSANATLAAANVAMVFEGGGPSGSEQGIISNREFANSCQPNLWITREPVIGTQIALCVSGTTHCCGCLAGSPFPGPTVVGPLTIPVGMPLALVQTIPFVPGQNTQCFPMRIPARVGLVGLEAFVMHAATFAGPPGAAPLELTPRLDLTFSDQ